MKTTKTAAALLLSVLITIFSISSGLPQPAKAQGTVTVEGTWLVTSVPPDYVGDSLGKRITIRGKGPGEYEVTYHTGETFNYWGNQTEIKAGQDLTFDQLKRGFQGKGVPDSAIQEAVGVQKTFSYKLSSDGHTLQFLQTGISFQYNPRSRRLTWQTVPPQGAPTILTRVDAPAPAPKAAAAPASQPAAAPAPAKKTATSPVAQVESRGEFYFLTKDGRKLTGAEANKVPLEEGGKVVTGKGGHIRLTLPDATTFTVGANSEIVIDKFVYDPDQSPKKVMVGMTKGVFRWVTGKTAAVRKDPAEMKVNLPVMAVGIRGTDFEAAVEPKGRGRVALYSGQLEITEKKTGYTFILDAGQMVTFGPDGKVSRPKKIKGAKMVEDEEED